MQSHVPWLCQGDVFSDVPIVSVSSSTKIDVHVDRGAALLPIENCQLDKRRRNRTSAVLWLQFLPLPDLNDAEPNLRQRLLAREVSPPSTVYVGKASSGEELYGHLGEAYPLPPAYFGLEMQSFEGNIFADAADPYHVVPTVNDSRIGRLTDTWLRTLHHKMWGYGCATDL